MARAFQSSNIFTATIIQPADHESNRLTIMPPTFEALSNMTDAGIYEDAITLKDGRWAGEPYVNGSKSRPIVGIVKDFMLTSDLDGDNSKEVAAILTENTGGVRKPKLCRDCGSVQIRQQKRKSWHSPYW